MTNKLKKVINEALLKNEVLTVTIPASDSFGVVQEHYIDMDSKKGGFTTFDSSFLVCGNVNLLQRLWMLLTNPFYYLFKGKWRI